MEQSASLEKKKCEECERLRTDLDELSELFDKLSKDFEVQEEKYGELIRQMQRYSGAY